MNLKLNLKLILLSFRLYHEIVRFQSGTYSEVFKSEDSQIHKTVVFKVIRAVSEQVEKKYQRLRFSGTETYDDIYTEVVITM